MVHSAGDRRGDKAKIVSASNQFQLLSLHRYYSPHNSKHLRNRKCFELCGHIPHIADLRGGRRRAACARRMCDDIESWLGVAMMGRAVGKAELHGTVTRYKPLTTNTHTHQAPTPTHTCTHTHKHTPKHPHPNTSPPPQPTLTHHAPQCRCLLCRRCATATMPLLLCYAAAAIM